MREREQVGVLPIGADEGGAPMVLLITSRETRRWVVPKGWPMKGKTPWAAALIEAEEEAGVRGSVGHDMLGSYRYDKALASGRIVPCRVRLYPMTVEETLGRWKEADERTRLWFAPEAAAEAVDEPDLGVLIRRVGRD